MEITIWDLRLRVWFLGLKSCGLGLGTLRWDLGFGVSSGGLGFKPHYYSLRFYSCAKRLRFGVHKQGVGCTGAQGG